MKTRSFLRNATVLNVLMMGAVIILAYSYVFLPLFGVYTANILPDAKEVLRGGPFSETMNEFALPSPSDFVVIGENNLFHPERIVPPEKTEAKPLPKPEFVLYGTMRTETAAVAYLEDLKELRSTSGRGRRQRALREGDSLSGFTLKEIQTGRIVMVRGEEKITVSIQDSHKKTKTVPQAASSSGTSAQIITNPQAEGIPQQGFPARPPSLPVSQSRKQVDRDVMQFLQNQGK